MNRTLLLSLVAGFLLGSPALAKTVRYELTATRSEVNLSGKKSVDFAIAINGSIPAPTLEFTEGDDAEIVVRNRLPGREELSIHWHGILLPNEMDGVPYLNTPPIRPGEEFSFRFKVRQHGTYWYHSHTGVQEQKGVYGALIIHPKKKAYSYDKDVVVVLSDWSDEDADDILKNLKKDGDYYLQKKGTMRSIFGAIQAGEMGTYFQNEWTRMGGMDLSDVGYDAFLINGKRDSQLATARPGDKIRIRVINAAASSYFYLSLAGLPMRVISADGIDIEPVFAKELLIGMAETYDILFEVPAHRNYELRATCQDVTGFASGWIGSGPKVPAPDKPQPDLYAAMDHGSHGSEEHAGHSDHSDHSDHAGHGSHARSDASDVADVLETLTVDDLRAAKVTAFSSKAKAHDVRLVLGGDMERYVWHINGKAIHEDRTIQINAGDVIRFTFVNETMMHHPMHLHGHFFRVLNKNGEHSPLKHTVDMGPHVTRTIEFLADEPGEWMLHCHNLYHMKTGMARVVSYSTFKPKPEMAHWQKHDPHNHDHWYARTDLEIASNHAEAAFKLSQTWNQFDLRIESRNSAGRNFSFQEPWKTEGDVLYRRWFGNFLNVTGGGTAVDDRFRAVVGLGYILPLLFESQALLDHRGKIRLDLEKRFQWTSSIHSDVEMTWKPNADAGIEESFEFKASLMYSPAWAWAAGLMLSEGTLGVGVGVRF